MKKSILVLAIAAVAVMFASCGTTYNLTDNNTHLLTVASSAYTLPTVAELQVTPTKISFQMTYKNNLSLKDISEFSASPKVQYMIKLTLNKAAEKYDADLIVAPNYSIATSEDFKNVTVSITGYPANYANFRTATASDMEMIKNGGGTTVVPCSASSINDREYNEFYAR
ncbi:MAG: hypothetical protein II793_03465 [Bacteroidales bacterium]|nr:hypothetical protein [Bacteroidales bacterium]